MPVVPIEEIILFVVFVFPVAVGPLGTNLSELIGNLTYFAQK